MKILSQRDLKWAALKLGQSPLTVGRYGCTTTCISMLSDYFGSYKDPGELATKVLKYTNEGLILWSSVDAIPHMKFEKRLYGRNDDEIMNALKDPNKAIILQVNNGAHWVVALRKTILGKSYTVADPWSGDKCDVIKRYKNITGAAVFIRK